MESVNNIFAKGDKLPPEYFTGDAFLKVLVNRDKNNEFVVGNITFEPGARTNWHTHPKGQILIVTEGHEFYQEKGGTVQIIQTGDVINIPENIEHWHGASPNEKLGHIAITNFKENVNVVWLHPVTDEQYKNI